MIAVAVSLAAGDGLAAAGDGRTTLRRNSWESNASFSSSNKAAETIKDLLGCSVSSSGTYSMKSSSKLPWLFCDSAIAESVPDEWILPPILWWIMSMFLAWTAGKEEWISVLRWWNTAVHPILTAWYFFLISHSHCGPSREPHSGGTLESPDSRLTDKGGWPSQWG